MSHIVSPCNGLAKCRRHPTGCAKIVTTAHEDWEARKKRKARKKRLWNMVLQHYEVVSRWRIPGMFEPIPREHHLHVVLLLEKLLNEEELYRSIDERQKSASI